MTRRQSLLVPHSPLMSLERDDYVKGFMSKTLGHRGGSPGSSPYERDGGSITLTTGVLAREPIATGAAAAKAKWRARIVYRHEKWRLRGGIRINAVSPNVLANSPSFHPLFPGQRPVTDEEIGTAYVLSVEGLTTAGPFASE